MPGTQHQIAFAFDSGQLFQSFAIRPLLVGTHEVLMYGRNVFVADNTPTSSDPSVIALSSPQFGQFCTGADPARDGGLCLGEIVGGPACAAYSSCEPDQPCVPCFPESFDAGDFPSRTSVGSAQLDAVSIGAAEIVLVANDGSTIDRLPLEVHAAARLFTDRTTVTVIRSQVQEVRAYAVDAAGLALEARYGITATIDAPNVALVAEHRTFPAPTFGTSVESYDVDIRGMQVGTANVTFVASGASTSVAVTVE
jgi:hypothetical protein